MSDELVSKRKGEAVEGFRILDELGRGAASIIYLAQNQKSKQIVALKHVQKLGPKDQRFLDQAEIEYRIAAELDHPTIRGIPKLIKKGNLIKVKELYLVMEYLDGMSMERHPPRTFEGAVDIFRQVARGLEHMHDRGFVHADMKPNNIVVNSKGDARIIDLGQSCRVGTIKPRIQGTPDYIAPEQVERKEITPATDVYNLGASIYWVLTRKTIPTALSGKNNSLLGSVDATVLKPPKSMREFNPRVPAALDALVMHCVKPMVHDRPTMTDVADRLETILAKLLADQRAAVSGSAHGNGDAGDGDTSILVPGEGDGEDDD